MMRSGELVTEHLRLWWLWGFPGVFQQACVKMCCLSQITSAALAFYFFFFWDSGRGDFFFILPSWPDNRRLLSGKLLWAVCSWCGSGSPGEQGDASSVSSPEEYSGVVKLVWCRSWRYFSLVLLKKIPYPSATEFLHSVVTADHPQSFCQGTKWFICNVVFNWQVGLLLWIFLVLLSQHNFFFWGWIGFFYLFAVELLRFQVARRSKMTEKAIRVSLKKLPSKNNCV